MATDAQWAAQGRALAEALGDHAYTRKDEDRKRVLMLQTVQDGARRTRGSERRGKLDGRE